MKLEPVRFQQTRQGVRDLDQLKEPFLPVSGGPIPRSRRLPNIAESERVLSFLGGAGIIGFGLGQQSTGGLLLALLGSALVQRGWTGHCSLYDVLGVNTADPAKASQEMAYVPS